MLKNKTKEYLQEFDAQEGTNTFLRVQDAYGEWKQVYSKTKNIAIAFILMVITLIIIGIGYEQYTDYKSNQNFQEYQYIFKE